MVDNLARHLVDLGNSLDMVDTQDTHLVVASLDTAVAMDMDIHKWMAWYTLVMAQDNLASLDLGSSLDLVARPMVVALMTTLVVMLVVLDILDAVVNTQWVQGHMVTWQSGA